MCILEIIIDDVNDIKDVATALHGLISSAEPHTDMEHKVIDPLLDQLESIIGNE